VDEVRQVWKEALINARGLFQERSKPLAKGHWLGGAAADSTLGTARRAQQRQRPFAKGLSAEVLLLADKM
jgi:hypothetical protein